MNQNVPSDMVNNTAKFVRWLHLHVTVTLRCLLPKNRNTLRLVVYVLCILCLCLSVTGTSGKKISDNFCIPNNGITALRRPIKGV